MPEINKKAPAEGYPPEEGCYLRGNDYSPVAVCVILKWIREQTPAEIEHLVRVGVESGAALSGTLQTENIGLEKVICNVIANPNIRYLIVFGPESPGHMVGNTIVALARNGIDEHKRIIGAEALTPYLFNLPAESVKRFRKQITVINLIDEGSPELLREAIAACYQEKPTVFRGYMLYDSGAYPEPPLSGKITWRVTKPQLEPKTGEEHEQRDKLRILMDRVRKSVEEKRGKSNGRSSGRQNGGKIRVLFLCTGNSCRSQMAEGFTRALKGGVIEPYSAGIEARGLDPFAVAVMAEAGVDISRQRSKRVDELKDVTFDYVVTVCGHAHENCPIFPGRTKVVHVGFDDPPKLAKGAKTEKEALAHYRRVRDEILAFVKKLPANLSDN